MFVCWPSSGPFTFVEDAIKSMTEETVQIPVLTPEEKKKLVDDAIERLDRLAESELEMARLFINRGKIEIARRRLQELIYRYAKSDAATEAKKQLKNLCATDEAGSP